MSYLCPICCKPVAHQELIWVCNHHAHDVPELRRKLSVARDALEWIKNEGLHGCEHVAHPKECFCSINKAETALKEIAE